MFHKRHQRNENNKRKNASRWRKDITFKKNTTDITECMHFKHYSIWIYFILLYYHILHLQ
jgi:hypothetical protein